MSADNWTHCPRCTATKQAEFAAREADIKASYGVATVEDFDRWRFALAAEREAFNRRPKTFREDYEITGAETGTVEVNYFGECQQCGLKLRFKDKHPIPGLEQP